MRTTERNETLPYRFVDKTRTMIVHEEAGQVLEWNPAMDKIVSDHSFAGEAYRTPVAAAVAAGRAGHDS